jgi:hypothetical protein
MFARMITIRLVRSEDFSPDNRRTKVLTTNLFITGDRPDMISYQIRSIAHNFYSPLERTLALRQGFKPLPG